MTSGLSPTTAVVDYGSLLSRRYWEFSFVMHRCITIPRLGLCLLWNGRNRWGPH